MLLTETELQEVQRTVQAGFPRIKEWEIMNEKNQDYDGFSIWGGFKLDPEELMSAWLFVTLSKRSNHRQGCLTAGKHSYYWSSTEIGDAHLLATGNCATLDMAIVSLKKQIVDFVSTLLGFDIPVEVHD